MKILVAGLGFIGEPLAEALHAAGHAVTGLAYSLESAERLRLTKSYPILQGDVSELGTLGKALANAGDFDHAVHCASSGRGGIERYEAVYLQGLRNLATILPETRLLFTSSTSVYAQRSGEWVDEASPAEPDRGTGQVLRAAEDVALAKGGVIARLAGLYGPNRSFLLLRFLTGEAVIEGDGSRWINQAHRDDVVSALVTLLHRGASGEIYNVVDSTPQSQRELYAFLSEHYGRPLPPGAPPNYDRKRGWTHKRLSNAKLKGLGWAPRYPAFQDAIQKDAELTATVERLANL